MPRFNGGGLNVLGLHRLDSELCYIYIESFTE